MPNGAGAETPLLGRTGREARRCIPGKQNYQSGGTGADSIIQRGIGYHSVTTLAKNTARADAENANFPGELPFGLFTPIDILETLKEESQDKSTLSPPMWGVL